MGNTQSKPEDYRPKDEMGYLSCLGCSFDGKLNEDHICNLSMDEKDKFTHLHGSCGINAHIYIRINEKATR